MKGKSHFTIYLFRLLPVLLCILAAACSDDDGYHYPSVKLEFLTAQADGNGNIKSILTDEGETFTVVENASDTRLDAHASARIVANYGPATTTDNASGVKLYASLIAISPAPKPESEFKDGVKNDPADVTSIWMGLDYLNIILDIKAQNGKHAFHFIEDEVGTDAETGRRFVHVRLYHSTDDVQAYSRRAYLSLPLRQYVEDGMEKMDVRFSLMTYSGEEKSYEFEYNPK
ncbi:NigD-like C-terminal domain-containing protein [uncultured Bacteroides sp.]|uniref:NigD1/NigD2 family lipoprotein n=1 Tax=uncultured Bacteroides sp. TaxID=162156 RepID=UPI00260ED387|nr:NigD-like C-terminal domain-containing protein [uncultured Bacteroides sp.]